MKTKPIPKSKTRGRPENEVKSKRLSKRVHPDIYNDCINYITQKTKEYKQSKGEL
jgi:hypothetical protein